MEYSSDKFGELAGSFINDGKAWKALDLYRDLVKKGLSGKERFLIEKRLRQEFPFLRTKDLYDLTVRYDLVLAQAPAWGTSTPPLALASLTAFMRNEGYRVLSQDLNIACLHIGGEKFMKTWELSEALVFWNNRDEVLKFAGHHKEYLERWADYVIGSGADIIGISVYGSSYFMSLYLAELSKKKKDSLVIVFGGPHMSKFLAGKGAAENPFVDIVVDGEGEYTLRDILERIKGGKELYGCPGTIQMSTAGVTVFEGRELIKDISSLPFPDFTDYDLKQYTKPNTMPVISSRGCPNSCIYCNERAFSKRFRPRKAESIFNDMKRQIALYPHVRYFEFHDSLVNGSIRELERLCDMIIEDGLKVGWSGQAIIRKEMDFALLSKLAKAGCICLGYGMETASVSLMKKIGKVFSQDADINKILEDSKRAGVLCALNFMFGLPGETEEDFAEVLSFLRRNKNHIGSVNPSAGFCLFAPGTKGYENPEQYGINFRHGVYYWASDDGKNNYEVRLKRFEAFCRLIYDLKINTTYPHRRLLDRDERLRDYFLKIGDKRKALPHLFSLLTSGRGTEQDRQEFFNCWNDAPTLINDIVFDKWLDKASIVKLFREEIEQRVEDEIAAGNVSEASAILAEALEVDKVYINFYLLLTECYVKVERFEDAINVLETLMEEQPDFEQAKVYREGIKNYLVKAAAV
ncbi:MAG: cobalamin B12-binding domain-containing protein [Nitrospirae bacterium]|nr:cobalamin B12-binding domain-containing protein [Nitrospirota bacterium]